MTSKLPTLSTELYDRLFAALLNCEEFENNVRLQESIKDGELVVYYQKLFTHEYETNEERIENTIKYLTRQRLGKVKLALPLLLLMLRDTLIEGDALRDELDDLHREVELELLTFYKTLSSSKIMKTIIPPTPPTYHSSLSNLDKIELVEDIFLDSSDREWIIGFVENVIEHKEATGRKNLLLGCIPARSAINSIDFDESTGFVAAKMVALIESRDKPNENVYYLEAFLRHLIKDDSREGEEVETKIEALLLKYKNRVSERSKRFHSQKYTNQLYKDQLIYQGLQEVSEASAINQPASIYKIDTSAIIQCNLDKQRTHFINGFHGHYKGFFTFAVTSVDHAVLKNYVIESLIWELRQRTKRATDIHHVYLYSEHFDSLSVEQGCLNLQKKLEEYFHIQSFNDLIEDNQDTDLVIVLWNRNISRNSFKHIAHYFSENLKAYVQDISLKRCFVLLWAHYGPAPLEPLDISIALPPFEQFEVEHVVEWLETHLSSLQKSKQIPEQAITYCRERLITKVTYHHGNLPGTYESLLEPWELGGLS